MTVTKKAKRPLLVFVLWGNLVVGQEFVLRLGWLGEFKQLGGPGWLSSINWLAAIQ